MRLPVVREWLHLAGSEAGVWTSLVAGTSGLAPFLHVVSGLLLFVATPLNLSTRFHQQSSQTIYMVARDIQETKIETSSLLKTSLATGTASLLVKAVGHRQPRFKAGDSKKA